VRRRAWCRCPSNSIIWVNWTRHSTHSALRFADRELREFSLEAAVAYLKLAYNFAPMFPNAAGNVVHAEPPE